MNANPVLKPKVATPALILSGVAILICAAFLVGTLAANGQSSLFLILAAVAFILLAAMAGVTWFARARRLRAWTAAAHERWNHFDDVKRTHGTTTEVTVQSVDALEPTGSWITIRWDRFDHVQRAWIEALRDPIWPGSVLLISPDPAQITPGAPWPAIYYISDTRFLAWAPLAARSASSQRESLAPKS
ncbi:hypothetical protein [Arthrobacter sp. H-02-3]|uniref:hypothetical protein n=1 Tax=Arthrobacter sp. H-02-3 TaxID=2703675 RepID=UPI000DD1C9ED|nr:hypothetical protein [Arthrobacter sp. H-02-3]PVZ60840.1 hypothetical protein C9424_00070 [Arthrobacter sp. H-02-3]